MYAPPVSKVGYPASGSAKGGENFRVPHAAVASSPYPLWKTYFPEEGEFIIPSFDVAFYALYQSIHRNLRLLGE